MNIDWNTIEGYREDMSADEKLELLNCYYREQDKNSFTAAAAEKIYEKLFQILPIKQVCPSDEALAEATDWCGVRSGRNFDKFKECGLTPEKSVAVAAPSIAESPISIECRVKQIIPLGSHDMFIGEVVNVAVDEQYIDAETGKLDIAKMRLLAYAHGAYFTIGEQIGTFGWTVKGSKLRKEIKHGKNKSKK